MSKKTLNYQLTGGKRPASWQLPIKNLMLEKYENGKSLGKRKIEFIPGNPSIFKEDHKGDEQPAQVWFEDGVLQVDSTETALVEILKRHKWNGVHFELVDHDLSAKKDLDQMELRVKAYEQVSSKDPNEMRARGYVLIGAHVIDLTDNQVNAQLKQLAMDEPERVLSEMKNPSYIAKTVGALAVLRDVLEINPTNTAVSWKGGKNIVTVAVGEDPIKKLGEFLSEKNEEAKITLQEIGVRIKRSYEFKEDYTAENELKDVLGDDMPDKPDLPLKENKDKVVDELQEARDDYEDVYEKKVPHNKKNDLDWIKNKVEEKVQSQS